MDLRTGTWWERAACREEDASVFFAPAYFEKRAEKLARESIAKGFCARCPVREECLDELLGYTQVKNVYVSLRP